VSPTRCRSSTWPVTTGVRATGTALSCGSVLGVAARVSWAG